MEQNTSGKGKSVSSKVKRSLPASDGASLHHNSPKKSNKSLDNDGYIARLKKFYFNEGRAELMKKFSYKNSMEIPRISKIVVSIGMKEAIGDAKLADKVVAELMLITGQKPVLTRAKKSIAGFKLRAGDILGCKVTLRSNMMYEFLDRLVNIALPAVRDFKGFDSTQTDGAANFSFGLKEQIVFPEIVYDKIEKIRGMNITVVTTAKTREEMKALLEIFDVPFYN